MPTVLVLDVPGQDINLQIAKLMKGLLKGVFCVPIMNWPVTKRRPNPD